LSSIVERSAARIEQVREGFDGVREVHEPILESPSRSIFVKIEAEGEVGRAAGLERGHDLARKICLGIQDELDWFAASLLEGGDNIPDGLLFLCVVALIPPHDEVGSPGAERCQVLG
jgi:hypothetical protein